MDVRIGYSRIVEPLGFLTDGKRMLRDDDELLIEVAAADTIDGEGPTQRDGYMRLLWHAREDPEGEAVGSITITLGLSAAANLAAALSEAVWLSAAHDAKLLPDWQVVDVDEGAPAG